MSTSAGMRRIRSPTCGFIRPDPDLMHLLPTHETGEVTHELARQQAPLRRSGRRVDGDVDPSTGIAGPNAERSSGRVSQNP
jgi:hypothetical protein